METKSFTHNNKTITISPSERKMPEELKTKVLAALRSGEYKQGVGQLSNGDSYCCLGVVSLMQGRLAKRDGFFCDSKASSTAFLFKDNPVGFICEFFDGALETLYLLNDSGWPFAIIADVIEFVY